MTGLVRAQPLLHSTVRETKVHGLQFNAKGQKTLTVWYTYLHQGNPAKCVAVCGCVTYDYDC